MLTSGDLIKDRYKIIKHLGSGGFGDTYLAEDTQVPSRRKCVVKQLKPIEDDSNIFKLVTDRFQREAAILENLGHNHTQVPDLYANFEDDGKFYLVQEYVEGQTLAEKVAQEGPMSDGAVRDLLGKLLPALEYVHSKGIVHRDLKPENAIVRESDGLPVLIDFGAVRETMGTIINSRGNPSSSIVIGTPGFMPSEQMAGRPVYASDLYSLGLIGIFCLTGKLPQEIDSDPNTGDLDWRQYAPDVSPALAEVLDKATQSHQRDRFSSSKEMYAAIQADGSDRPVAAPLGPSPTIVSNGSIGQAPTVVSSGSIGQAPTTVSLGSGGIAPVPPPGVPYAYPYSSPPGMAPPYTGYPVPPAPAGTIPDWLKAVLVGGIVGGIILGGFVVVRNLANNSSSSDSSSSPTPTATESIPALSQAEAIDLINRWQAAKRTIFANPFDRNLLAQLNTGEYLRKNNGSIDWLTSNGSYYDYGTQKVESVENFSVNGADGTIDVVLAEERRLYKNGRIVYDGNTAFDTRLVRYNLRVENGVWKLSDANTLRTIRSN